MEYVYSQTDESCNDAVILQHRTEQVNCSDTKFEWPLRGLKPNMKARIKTQVKNSAGDGPENSWSGWFGTLHASDKTLSNIKSEFSLTSAIDFITVDLKPMCPYQGLLNHLVPFMTYSESSEAIFLYILLQRINITQDC